MKWILALLCVYLTANAFSEETVENAMAEMKKFTIAYTQICETKRDHAATDAFMSLQKTNPKAATVVANYWYAKAVQSYPGKWTEAALLPVAEDASNGGMIKKEQEYLVSYYYDHVSEIKATVDMLWQMTK